MENHSSHNKREIICNGESWTVTRVASSQAWVGDSVEEETTRPGLRFTQEEGTTRFVPLDPPQFPDWERFPTMSDSELCDLLNRASPE